MNILVFIHNAHSLGVDLSRFTREMLVKEKVFHYPGCLWVKNGGSREVVNLLDLHLEKTCQECFSSRVRGGEVPYLDKLYKVYFLGTLLASLEKVELQNWMQVARDEKSNLMEHILFGIKDIKSLEDVFFYYEKRIEEEKETRSTFLKSQKLKNHLTRHLALERMQRSSEKIRHPEDLQQKDQQHSAATSLNRAPNSSKLEEKHLTAQEVGKSMLKEERMSSNLKLNTKEIKLKEDWTTRHLYGQENPLKDKEAKKAWQEEFKNLVTQKENRLMMVSGTNTPDDIIPYAIIKAYSVAQVIVGGTDSPYGVSEKYMLKAPNWVLDEMDRRTGRMFAGIPVGAYKDDSASTLETALTLWQPGENGTFAKAHEALQAARLLDTNR